MAVSEGHVEIVTEAEMADAAALDRAWTAPEIAAAQRALADREVERWRRGEDVAPFAAYVALMRAHAWDYGSVLDVGCGSGYYSSVLFARGWVGKYVGLDYSDAMVEIASRSEPGGYFRVGDARALPYGDGAFPVVVSGCAMLHIATPHGWQKSMREATRVSSRWVMFHKTPLLEGQTRCYRKRAYGVECFERWFGEAEFRAEVEASGLAWVEERTCSTMSGGRWTSIMCRKA